MSRRQREALSETVRELANLAAAALVLGQFVGQQRLSWDAITVGVAVWFVFVAFSLVLMGAE